MEAAEDTSLQPAIGWLAQNILGSLQIDGMDAWIRRAGLLNDIEVLKSEVDAVDITVVDKRLAGNNRLAPSLADLKKLLYDAEEVVDELDHYRLEQQVKGVTWEGPESMPGADQADERWMTDAGIPSSSAGKKRGYKNKVGGRCAAWDHFYISDEKNGDPVKAKCKHCQKELLCHPAKGTTVLTRHLETKKCLKARATTEQPLNPCSSSGDVTAVAVGSSSSRKRTRTDNEAVQITAANTHSVNMTEFSSRISDITRGLQNVLRHVNKVLHLHGLSSASSSNHYQSTTSDQHLRTSSVLPRKVYGRVAEKNSIIKLITENKSSSVAVLPIVGIGGVGKTTLAQLVYNDEGVKCQFNHRIWVWLSRNFDEVRLIREMLDFIPQERNEVPEERHEGISSFAKLQEVLASRANSKRLLFVLDDVWDDMTDGRWENLLKPIKSGCAIGSVILVTTRDVSVAKMTGTTEHTKLGALEHDDFQLLFKSCAFNEHYEGDQNLINIGQRIAEKLKGNPLAAESTGKLLRKEPNSDNWNDILKNEGWKSLKLSRGIMTALKLTYDQLPYNLQQCFAYCSIYPDGYQFHGGELARIWISQGYVKGNHSSKTAKEIELNYLTRLVNLGFFQQVEREESSLGSQTCYIVCGLLHDFARMVSQNECTTIDGPQCNEMPRTIRHLSIVTDSEYRKDLTGNILRNEKFEENLRNTITSVSKLRTLVLLGHYDSFFLLLFQDIFQKAHNLRVLQLSATSADFLQRGYDEVDGALPQVLSKLYHLQVLDVGSYTDPTIPDGINNLVSLRHFVVHKGVYSSGATIDSMTSFQEPHGFKFQISSGSEVTQPQTMSDFVQDSVHQLDNVETLKEVYEALMKKNELLGKMHLSWKGCSTETGVERLPMDESGPDSELSLDKAREVLERFELRQHLKSLQIYGYRYSDATAPIGLASNISFTSLLKLQLYGCGKWQILPPLDRLPFLTKLKLSDLEEVKEILVPSLEELVLVKMLKLERCSCTSVEGMNSRLRALQIEQCYALKEFDLFENDDEQRSWLPGLRKLILYHCPLLEVLNPLPPSSTVTELLIRRVSTLPTMKGSSGEKLHIGYFDDDDDDDDDVGIDEFSDGLEVLDNEILAFHNLGSLKFMRIVGCKNLSSFSFKGFSQLVSLKSLTLQTCEELFSSDAIHEDATAENCKAFPSLESLRIESCGIAGKLLSLLLRLAPGLQELYLWEAIELVDSSSGEQDDALTGLAQDGPVHIPLNLISSLKKITIKWCPRLTFNWSEEGFSGFTSLQELSISGCNDLLSSLKLKDENDDQVNERWLLPKSLGIGGCSQETLQPCFPRNLTSLKKLQVEDDPGLESLQLHSCTALEELVIENCGSLTALEGLQSLGSLKHLTVSSCPGLSACLESFARQGYELCSRLETLDINDPSVLTTSFCERLNSLRRLKLHWLVLNEDQESALLLLTSLQELEFYVCSNLVDLPAGLHLLPSLKWLKIWSCQDISRLPETGLPLSLEELEIVYCSQELADQCRLLATSKLRVKIDERWLVL